MSVTINKDTIGTVDQGVRVIETLYIPSTGKATGLSGSVGTESAPTVYGGTFQFPYKLSFAEVTGSSASTWDIQAPTGKWELVDMLVSKTGILTGSTGDKVEVKSIKSGVTSSVLMTADLSGSTLGSLVRPTSRSNTSGSCTVNSQNSDKIRVILSKATNTAKCDVFLYFNLQ